MGKSTLSKRHDASNNSELVAEGVRLRILLVEDDQGFTELLRTSLTPVAPGIELKTASRLSSAVAAIATERLDAILLDLNLPDSQGLQTLHEVTGAAAGLPVVVLTGMDDARLAHQALRLGAEDWLTKPFSDPDVVVRALRYAIERKRLTHTLVRLQKLEAVGRLAGSVAHEFNNVLTAILGNVELADCATDPGVKTRALREVRHATMRGSLLTRQLLGVSRPRAASPPRADVASVVTTLKDLFEAVLPRRIEVRIEPIEALRVAIAPEHLEQVLLNLLLNARDAMADDGTIFIAAKRIPEVSDPRGGTGPGADGRSLVHIAVRDTGPGIDPDVLPHIFEAFFTTKGRSGTGLGLAISKELIEQAGGHIRVENARAAGATFVVELPEVIGN